MTISRQIRDNFSDNYILNAIWALLWRWVVVTGGAAITFCQYIYKYLRHGQDLPANSAWVLAICFVIAAVWAHASVQGRLYGKNRFALVRQIRDEYEESKKPRSVVGRGHVDMVRLFIEHCEDFSNDQEVLKAASEIGKHLSDPFELLRLRYEARSLKGKYLRLLKDARLSDWKTNTDSEFIDYVEHVWADGNGLKERTGEPRAKFAILRALNK